MKLDGADSKIGSAEIDCQIQALSSSDLDSRSNKKQRAISHVYHRRISISTIK